MGWLEESNTCYSQTPRATERTFIEVSLQMLNDHTPLREGARKGQVTWSRLRLSEGRMDRQDNHSTSLPCDFQGNQSSFLYIFSTDDCYICTFNIFFLRCFSNVHCLPIFPKACGLCSYTANHAHTRLGTWAVGKEERVRMLGRE